MKKTTENIGERLKKIEEKKERLMKKMDAQERELERVQDIVFEIRDNIDELFQEEKDLEEELESIEHRGIVDSNNNLPDDDFHNKFILASEFTAREKDAGVRPFLNYVTVEKDKLVAIDGYRLFIAKEVDVPKNLQNNLIAWHERYDLEKGKNIDDGIVPFNYKYLLEDVASNEKIEGTNMKNLYKKLIGKATNLEVFEFNDMQIGFNAGFMKDAKALFKGDVDITYPDSKYNPIMIEDENYKMVILPIRLTEEY